MFKYAILMLILSTSFLYSQPKVKIIEGVKHDWGDVRPIDSPLKKRIHITNVGNQALRIYEVKPTCGCTTAPLDKDVLMPGDTAKIDITLNLKDDKWKITKSVKIMSNDPENPNAKIELMANVLVPIEKLPAYLPFGSVQLGSKAEAELEIKNNTDKDITIMKVIKTPLNLDINIEEGTIIKAKSSFIVKAYMNPSKEGKFECALTLMTDNIDSPRIKLNGWGKVTK